MKAVSRGLPDRYKGIICIVFSAFCFAFMNAFVRLSGDLPSVQKSFFRNFIAFFIAVILLLRSGERIHIVKGSMKYLVARAALGTLGVLCNFYAVDHLVLSDASMLNKMSPFFSILFSFIILKERLTLPQGAIVAAAFCGSLFIVKPTADIFENSSALIGLLGGICAGAAYAMVRVLGQKGVSKSFIVLFFSAFSCIVTLPYIILNYEPMTLRQLLLLIGAGVAAAGGQFGITSAYCYAPAKEISVYDYSQLIFAMLLGFVLFGQIPDALSVVGYVIIIAAAVVMFIYNKNKE
ncbi:MAG: DMT family transporter [Ruminococcus sp.]|nr:DMT family transporter [Ruminococcus sp.]